MDDDVQEFLDEGRLWLGGEGDPEYDFAGTLQDLYALDPDAAKSYIDEIAVDGAERHELYSAMFGYE